MGIKVLIIDSNIEHRADIISFLQEQEHSVEDVISISEIINKCKTKCPDLIILDSNVTGTPGTEVVRQIRQLGGDAAWNPIVLMGQDPSEEELTLGLEAGADDYLTKPLNKIALRYKVESASRLQELKEEVFAVAHELVLATHALETGATQDGMTGLLDAQSFHKALEKEWYNAKKNNSKLSIAIINIDNFRAYNEKYGSKEGDNCIKKVATALKRSIPRHFKILARTLGDNFVLLMPNTNKYQAYEIGKKIHESVDKLNIPNISSPSSDHITTSIGIASTEEEEQKNPLQLMEAADFALYQAKHKGRNMVFMENVAKA